MNEPRHPAPDSEPAADEPAMPQLRQGELDAAQLETLFAELRQAAEVTEVRVRIAEAGRPSDRTMTLDEAQQLLKHGKAPAVQIRYRHDGRLWCDTLMVRGDATRLIRMPLPADFDGPGQA